MAIEGAADGSVRLPGTRTLAGSALTLDAAVRNVAAWGVASAQEAVAMASAAPTALLAPALQAHGLALPDNGVEWDALRVTSARVGDMRVG
jgi:N-acetylglucosamine-6-phosphate deacetylase